MKIEILDEQVTKLKELSEWLSDQQYKPYQPDFNEKANNWYEIIKHVIEEAESEN